MYKHEPYQLTKNSLQLHLSTCADNIPHISLMNYTYLPSSPYTTTPTIIMTTTPSSRKTLNLLENPRVSLLVHDWISHRPPTLQSTASPERPGLSDSSSPLADLLRNLNMSSLSRISTTINGTASLVPSNSEAEAWLKAKHLENNTFGPPQSAQDPLSLFSSSPTSSRGAGAFGRDDAEADGGKSCYLEGEEVRVVIVNIKDGRIADWQGGYKDWELPVAEPTHLTNGV